MYIGVPFLTPLPCWWPIRQSLGVDKFSVREDAFSVNERLRYLDNLIDSSSYNQKKKGALEKKYLKFLGCSSVLEFLLSSPEIFVNFLSAKIAMGELKYTHSNALIWENQACLVAVAQNVCLRALYSP